MLLSHKGVRESVGLGDGDVGHSMIGLVGLKIHVDPSLPTLADQGWQNQSVTSCSVWLSRLSCDYMQYVPIQCCLIVCMGLDASALGPKQVAMHGSSRKDNAPRACLRCCGMVALCCVHAPVMDHLCMLHQHCMLFGVRSHGPDH